MRALAKLAPLVLILGTAGFLAGCGGSSSGKTSATNASSSDKSIHIVLSYQGGSEVPFWGVSEKGMNAAAHDLGISAQWVAPQCCNSAEQAQMLQAALGSHPSGVAVMLSDPQALSRPILQALNEHIPVVAVNVQYLSKQSNPQVQNLAYIGQDETKSGAHAASLLAPYVKPGSQVLCINPDPTNIVAVFRCSSATSYFASKGIKTNTLVDDSTVPSEQLSILNGFMEAHSNITGMIAPGPSGDVACKWLETHPSMKGKVALGTFDLDQTELNCVANGTSKFSLDQQPFMQGYMAVVDLYDSIKYGMTPAAINTGTAVITQQNWQQYKELTSEGIGG